MFSLKNKKAIITGGGSGIGKAIALTFAKQGAFIYIVDINKTQAESVVQEITNAGGKATYIVCNVVHQNEVFAPFKDIHKIDILVNSAGISHIGKLENTTEQDFEKLFNVNVKGTYNTMLAALPLLQKNESGVILNIASIAALVGIPDRFAYAMTKGAIYAMTMSVAKDYIKQHIRCNSISPARVYTPFVENFLKNNYPGKEEEMFQKLSQTQPIGRMAQPQEIANLALYLCSDEANFITGCDYPIDGGFTKLNN